MGDGDTHLCGHEMTLATACLEGEMPDRLLQLAGNTVGFRLLRHRQYDGKSVPGISA